MFCLFRIGWQPCYTSTLVSDLALSLILSELSRIVRSLLRVNLTLCHMSAVCSAISSRLITSNVSSILIVFHHFFSRIAWSTVDLHVCVILLTKANAVEGGTPAAAQLYR